jgi:Flp pilus assembly protein TadG
MRILRDESGQATILVALFLGIVFLGCAALVVDAGMLYREKTMVQTAADAAAIAVSAQYSSNPNINTHTVALSAAEQQWGIASSGTNVVQVVVTPKNTANSDFLVTVTQPTRTYFLGAFRSQFNSVTIGASGEAAKPTVTACAVALSPTGIAAGSYPLSGDSGTGGIMAGNTGYPSPQINVTGCGVCANSAIIGFANGTGISTNQGANAGGGFTGTVTATGGKTTTGGCSNPYASLTLPSGYTSTGCSTVPWPNGGNGGQALVLPANPAGPPYCNFNDQQAASVTLSGGTYLFSGTFTLNYAQVTSSAGTTLIFLPGSNLNGGSSGTYGFANGMNMQISAPTAGAYAGVAIWDDSGTSSSPDTMTFNGGSTSTINGAIYAPYTNISDGNGSGVASVNGSVIAWTISVGGSGGLNIDDTSGGSGSTTSTVALVN